jgi:hypothetical protein
MTDILTLWVDCVNQFNRKVLSGYQASDLGEMGGNLVHSGSCIHPNPGFLASKEVFGLAAVGHASLDRALTFI